MFSFANPEYLYLLLLLPVVAGLFWLSQRAKAKKIAKFGRAGVVKGLMPEQSKYKPWIRLTVELVLLATIVVILARPRGGAQETNTTMKGIEVMICLDVSNSMNAASDDDAPDVSRLQRSKQVLEKLIDRITGNKVGLIVFAGNAYMQMPHWRCAECENVSLQHQHRHGSNPRHRHRCSHQYGVPMLFEQSSHTKNDYRHHRWREL